jgi:transcription initiation factor TFIIB
MVWYLVNCKFIMNAAAETIGENWYKNADTAEKVVVVVFKIKKYKNNVVNYIQPMDQFDSTPADVSRSAVDTPVSAASKAEPESLENLSKDIIKKPDKKMCITSIKKTKKNNNPISYKEKMKLWEVFDTDVHSRDTPAGKNSRADAETPKAMECIYQDTETDLCSLCNSVLHIMEDGFPTCTNTACGIIYKNTLDYSPEWRYYGADDKNTNDPTRCGNPINPLLVESSFGCKILCDSRSSYEMKKIRKWTEWIAMPHREKSLYDEFQFISNMAQNAGIPKIFIDNAITIHKDISAQKMFRGMNRDSIKAASIYISCRLNGCPRTAYEIAEIFKLDKASATNGCSMAVNILQNIERGVVCSQKVDLGTTLPSSFIERFCSKLNISQELTILAKFIAKKVETGNIICDNTPHAVASGIIYLISQICHLNLSKLEIKAICGVSEVTINKCFRKLDVIKDKLIPLCILQRFSAV